jgi:hypothetical protein
VQGSVVRFSILLTKWRDRPPFDRALFESDRSSATCPFIWTQSVRWLRRPPRPCQSPSHVHRHFPFEAFLLISPYFGWHAPSPFSPFLMGAMPRISDHMYPANRHLIVPLKYGNAALDHQFWFHHSTFSSVDSSHLFLQPFPEIPQEFFERVDQLISVMAAVSLKFPRDSWQNPRIYLHSRVHSHFHFR